MTPKPWALLAAVGMMAAAARGQSTLGGWIAEALENNPEIAAARETWEGAKARVPQAAALPDPMFGADVERADSTSFSDYNDIEWMVLQDVPGFGKRGAARRAEAARAFVTEMELHRTERAVKAGVKRAFFDLWQAERDGELNERDQELMRQFADIAGIKYETGKATQSDMLKARTELARLLESHVDISRRIRAAGAEISRLIGQTAKTAFSVKADDLAPVMDFALEDVQEAARKHRPELRAFENGHLAAATAELGKARTVNRPDVQFRAEARQFEGEGDISEYDTAVFLSFPWFNAGRNRGAVREAKANLAAAQQSAEAMRLQTEADVKTLYDGIETMHHHYELYRDRIVPLQKAAVEAARSAYESDRTSFLDVLDAQRMLLDDEMQNVHHVAEFHRLVADLETVAGVDLEEFE